MNPSSIRSLLWIAAILCLPVQLFAQCPSASNLTVSNGICSIRLNWQPPAGGSLRQHVLRSIFNDVSTAVAIATLGPTGSAFVDTNPNRGNTNFYWIRAEPVNPVTCPSNNHGPQPGSMVNFAPAPVSITPTCAGVEIVAQSVFDATSYEFVRLNLDGSNRVQFVSTSNTFTDATAAPGTEYVWSVYPSGACGRPASALVDTEVARGLPQATVQSAAKIGIQGESLVLGANVFSDQGTTVRWKRDGVPIDPMDPRYLGASSASLTIVALRWDDAATYTLTATNSCGPTTTTPIIVSVRPGCRADFDESGSLASADIFAFLNSWFAGCP